MPLIGWRLLTTVCVGAAVTVLHLKFGYFETSLTPLPFSLIGVALGIFLGFRNNTSYDRYWEGRKLWGGVVNASRSLARQAHTMVDDDDVTTEVGRLLIAYVHALRIQLRGESHEKNKALESISGAETLYDSNNLPIRLLAKIGRKVEHAWRAGRVDTLHVPTLEGSLTELTALQGACERIKSTPIPYSYTVLIHRLTALYCFALPFGIADDVGMATPIVVAGVAYAFFGLDAIGEEIEEPFGLDDNDLPLTTISTMIEANVAELMEFDEIPALLKPDARGLLT